MKTIREETGQPLTDHETPNNATNKVVLNGGTTNVGVTTATNHNGVVNSNPGQVFRKILPGEPTTRKVLSKRNKASSQPPIAEELQANFE